MCPSTLPKQARYQLRYTRIFFIYCHYTTVGEKVKEVPATEKIKGFFGGGDALCLSKYTALLNFLLYARFSLGILGLLFFTRSLYRVYYAAFNTVFTTLKYMTKGPLIRSGGKPPRVFAIFRRTAQVRVAEAGRSTRNAFSRDKTANIIIQPLHKCKKILYRRTKFCYNLL